MIIGLPQSVIIEVPRACHARYERQQNSLEPDLNARN
jgi:hypothetical protein